MNLIYASDGHLRAIKKISGAPATINPPAASLDDKNKRQTTDRVTSSYLPGLRRIENELDAFLANKFVWLGY